MGMGMNNFAVNYQRQNFGPALAGPQDLSKYWNDASGVKESVSMGFNAAAGIGGPAMAMGMGAQVGLGPQLSGFQDQFAGFQMNAFGRQGMAMGGMNFGGNMGGIAAFGAMQNPAMQMAYQARYGGAQFGGAGQVASFRGGVGSAQFNATRTQQMPTPNWMATSGNDFKNGSILDDMIMDGNKKLSADVAELQAAGVAPEAIKMYVKQQKLSVASNAMALMTTLSRSFHDMAKSVIQNIRA